MFSRFVFAFFGSLIGVRPFKPTFTSQLIVTFGLALMAFLYVATVEVVSCVFRPVTLAELLDRRRSGRSYV